MICRIQDHIITPEGDFVPAHTPCKVLGWGEDGKIEVRAAGYVFADSWSCRETSEDGTDNPATGRDLIVRVDPGNLVFDSMESSGSTPRGRIGFASVN